MATIAAFLEVSGGAYAAITLPRNSVGSRLLERNSVSSSKVKNGSLLLKDFKSGQLSRGARGPQGAAGPQGATGPQGLHGDTGASGLKGDPGQPGLVGTPGPGMGNLHVYGTGTADIDGVARAVAPGISSGCAHVDVNIVSASACDYHALVIPPS